MASSTTYNPYISFIHPFAQCLGWYLAQTPTRSRNGARANQRQRQNHEHALLGIPPFSQEARAGVGSAATDSGDMPCMQAEPLHKCSVSAAARAEVKGPVLFT
jgi:hypothetical protein